MMKFTEEMMAKAKTAVSAEELMKLAAEEGVLLTAEEAEKYFSFLSEDGELTDEALETVAGGKGDKPKPNPKYKVGQTLWIYFPSSLNYMRIEITEIAQYDKAKGYLYYYLAASLKNPHIQSDYLESKEDRIRTTDPMK